MKKGYTIAGMMGTLLISSVVLLTLTQLIMFLVTSQVRVTQNAEMVRESNIIQQSIRNAFNNVRPTSYQTCTTYSQCFIFTGSPTEPSLIVGFDGVAEDMQVYVYYDNEAPYQIPLNTTLSNATIGLSACTSCTEDVVFVVEYTVYTKTPTVLHPYENHFAFLLY